MVSGPFKTIFAGLGIGLSMSGLGRGLGIEPYGLGLRLIGLRTCGLGLAFALGNTVLITFLIFCVTVSFSAHEGMMIKVGSCMQHHCQRTVAK